MSCELRADSHELEAGSSKLTATNHVLNGVAQATGTYVWHLSFTHHDNDKKVLMNGYTIVIRWNVEYS
jgi:hypothetical protein